MKRKDRWISDVTGNVGLKPLRMPTSIGNKSHPMVLGLKPWPHSIVQNCLDDSPSQPRIIFASISKMWKSPMLYHIL